MDGGNAIEWRCFKFARRLKRAAPQPVNSSIAFAQQIQLAWLDWAAKPTAP